MIRAGGTSGCYGCPGDPRPVSDDHCSDARGPAGTRWIRRSLLGKWMVAKTWRRYMLSFVMDRSPPGGVEPLPSAGVHGPFKRSTSETYGSGWTLKCPGGFPAGGAESPAESPTDLWNEDVARAVDVLRPEHLCFAGCNDGAPGRHPEWQGRKTHGHPAEPRPGPVWGLLCGTAGSSQGRLLCCPWPWKVSWS